MTKEATNNDLIIAIEKLDRKVTGVREELGKEITGIRKELGKEIADLASSTANGFAHVESRLDKVETNTSWTRDILEKHSGMLTRLDQERFFTINHVNQLEEEIKRIKVQLKIS